MGTSATEVFDLFLMLQQDYKLTTLYQTSGSDALNTYLEGWLIFSADEFSEFCDQPLTYDSTIQEFTQTLSQENINMLSQIMTKYWLQKEVQNVLQMNVNILDHDFKTFSQAQNLSAKKQYYDDKKEEISQLLMSYGYRHNNWSNWRNQDYA